MVEEVNPEAAGEGVVHTKGGRPPLSAPAPVSFSSYFAQGDLSTRHVSILIPVYY